MSELTSHSVAINRSVDAEVILSSDDINADPATFALTHHVFSRSVWHLKDLYESVPAELHELLDSLIDRLCARHVGKVSGGKLIFSKNYFFTFFDNQHLSQFLPQVFQIGVEAVLAEKQNVPGRRVDYMAIPNTEVSARAMREAAHEYLAKLRMIQAEAMRSREAEGAPVRFVGLLSNVINLNEFV